MDGLQVANRQTHHHLEAPMEKIRMTTPLVEMDGDEMTRIIWQADLPLR